MTTNEDDPSYRIDRNGRFIKEFERDVLPHVPVGQTFTLLRAHLDADDEEMVRLWYTFLSRDEKVLLTLPSEIVYFDPGRDEELEIPSVAFALGIPEEDKKAAQHLRKRMQNADLVGPQQKELFR
jgi:hypothetical protein